MIELKDAIEKAKSFINDIDGQPDGLQIEEAFISTDETYWAVSISYLRNAKSDFQSRPADESARVLKTVHVDVETGRVTGMYNQT